MFDYQTYVDTDSISHYFQDIPHHRFLFLTLDPQDHRKSKFSMPVDRPYVTSSVAQLHLGRPEARCC